MKAYTLKLTIIATILTLSNGAIAAPDTHSINDSWTFTLTGDTTKTAVHLPHSWNSDAYHTHDYKRTTGVYTRKAHHPCRNERENNISQVRRRSQQIDSSNRRH